MSERAAMNGIPFEPPYIPQTFLSILYNQDAAAAPFSDAGPSNPFYAKKILVLAGAEDKMVPWSASKTFVEQLKIGPEGVKEVILEPGVGHECTKEMVRAMSTFIWEQALA